MKAIQLEIHYTETSKVIKGFNAFKEETLIFYKGEEQTLYNSVSKIVSFLKKNNGYMYVQTYDPQNIPAGTTYHMFLHYRKYTDTFICGTYPTGKPESYDHSNEREYSPKKATENFLETVEALFYE